MANLFEQTVIGDMRLRNRFARSATWEGMCKATGCPTKKLVRCYRDLAAGGVGLIITGYTFVSPEGKQLPGKMGIHTGHFSIEMKTLTGAVHEKGGKICIQLVHAGGQTDAATAGRKPLAPSAVEVPQYPEVPQEMTKEDIKEIVEDFGVAARRAKEYGFDAIQLHGAHGYLINQFLSPLTNRRQDEYGGDINNRLRFLFDVYNRVRHEVGEQFPVMIKLNGSDFLEGGLVLEDAIIAAKKLDKAGIDAIEVSGGTPASEDKNPIRIKIDKPEREAYNLSLAKQIKSQVSCPVMLVGGIRSYEVAEQVVNDEGMDYVSLSRPLIREPDLIERWRSGDTAAAKCISCNGCFKPGLKEGGIYCVIDKKEKERNSEES